MKEPFGGIVEYGICIYEYDIVLDTDVEMADKFIDDYYNTVRMENNIPKSDVLIDTEYRQLLRKARALVDRLYESKIVNCSELGELNRQIDGKICRNIDCDNTIFDKRFYQGLCEPCAINEKLFCPNCMKLECECGT